MKTKIYIILSYTGTNFSKLLKVALREKYVHVSLSLDDKFSEVYSFGRKNPKHMFPSGFVKEDIVKISKIFKKSICEVYELEIDKQNYRKLKKKIKEFSTNEELYKYNILGLIPIKFNIKFERKNHYVCSQFVGLLLQEAGIYDLDKHYSLIKPKDIENINNLKKIYEGRMINILPDNQ